MSKSVPSSPNERKQGPLPVAGSAENLVGRVLRDQGLGKYCDPEFVRAASREMQEAMDMTPEEFDEAAHRLLQAEQEGQLRLPSGAGGMGGLAGALSGVAAASASGAQGGGTWASDDEEEMMLRSGPGRDRHGHGGPGGGGAGGPQAPTRSRGGAGARRGGRDTNV